MEFLGRRRLQPTSGFRSEERSRITLVPCKFDTGQCDDNIMQLSWQSLIAVQTLEGAGVSRYANLMANFQSPQPLGDLAAKEPTVAEKL